jgi:hypothetical protein
MIIQLKCCFTLLGSIYRSEQSEDKYPFTVPSKSGKDVTVEVFPKKKRIDSYDEKDVSNRMWMTLQTEVHEGRLLPQELQSKLSQLTSDISDATRKVLSALKYYLNCYTIDESLFSVKGQYWLTNESKWKRLPSLFNASIDSIPVYPLDSNTVKLAQSYIKEGIEPFLALRHLQKARAEQIPRYKWIDAAIAAELAIKQYLIIKDPSKWMNRLQRPHHIEELYGKYLKQYSGEESPVLAELKKGATIRNDILHYRREVNISPQDAIDYVQLVEIAIYHLLTLLYSGDLMINRHYANVSLKICDRLRV